MKTIAKEVHDISGKVGTVGSIIEENCVVNDGNRSEYPSKIINDIISSYEGRNVKIRIEVCVEEINESIK